jgi:hypothetical protein
MKVIGASSPSRVAAALHIMAKLIRTSVNLDTMLDRYSEAAANLRRSRSGRPTSLPYEGAAS